MSLTDRLSLIYDTFSRRPRGRGVDYAPDVIGEKARMRILLLIRDVYTGTWRSAGFNPQGDYGETFWEQIHNVLEHLYGRAKLSSDLHARRHIEDGLAFVETCSTSEFCDFLEAIFKIECTGRVFWNQNELVEPLNMILRSEGVPYQLTPFVTHEEPNAGPYGQGTAVYIVALPKVVRVDDEVTHTEAVMPALSMLADPSYKAPNEEFRNALDDYRKGDFGDCLVKCGSAFESVLKILCQKNRIAFDANKATLGPLLDKVLSKSKLDTATFKEPLIAVGRMRNHLSPAHGGGASVKAVERHVAQYAVTATAAAIVLLVHDMGR